VSANWVGRRRESRYRRGSLPSRMTNITGTLDPKRATITGYSPSYREIYEPLKGLTILIIAVNYSAKAYISVNASGPSVDTTWQSDVSEGVRNEKKVGKG
jgi:hypothetical protein